MRVLRVAGLVLALVGSVAAETDWATKPAIEIKAEMDRLTAAARASKDRAARNQSLSAMKALVPLFVAASNREAMAKEMAEMNAVKAKMATLQSGVRPMVSSGAPVSTSVPTGKTTQASIQASVADWNKVKDLFHDGQLERGINAAERILQLQDERLASDRLQPGYQWGSLEELSVMGVAITVAGWYSEYLSDPKRGHDLAQEIERRCVLALATSTGTLAQSWKGMSNGARSNRFRALQGMGSVRELTTQVEKLGDEWRAAHPAAEPFPASLMQQSFFFGEAFSVIAAMQMAGDALEGRAVKGRSADEFYQRGLALCQELAPKLPDAKGPTGHIPLAWRAHLLRHSGYFHGKLSNAVASDRDYQSYLDAATSYGKRMPGAPSFDAYGRVYIEHAQLLSGRGAYEDALAAAKRAKQWLTTGLNRKGDQEEFQFMKWKPDYLAGICYQSLGRFDESELAFKRSIQQLEEFYLKLRSGRVKGAFLRMKECGDVYRRLIGLLVKRGATEEAFQFLEQSKSTALLDKLRGLDVRDRSHWTEDMVADEARLKRQIRELKRSGEGDFVAPQVEAEPAAGERTRSRSAGPTLPEVRWELELLQRKIEDRKIQATPKELEVSAVSRVPTSEILEASKSTPKRLLVSYFHDGEVLSCFTIRDGVLGLHSLGKLASIRKSAGRLRRRVTGRSKRWKKPASQLFGALVKPWQESLDGIEELVVVPTGFLYSLPFACLLDADAKPLAGRVALSVLSQASLTTPSSAQAAPAPSDAAWSRKLLLADPDGSLPSALVEADGIAAECEDTAACTVKKGAAASEDWLKHRVGFGGGERGGPPAVLHLATHGLLLKEQDLFSSLVLAPNEAEDGNLEVREIYNELDLRSAPVVVLSACNTGVGADEGGDEILGLSRAFQYAGAPWVVASLWEVSDAASADLMQQFHRALPAGGRVDEALRQAMLATRGAKDDWSHPFYWAAFTAFRR